MRKFAAVALASALLFSTAGCSFTRDVETAKMYAPSDGAQVDLTNGIKARNFIYLTNGVSGSLIGSLINGSSTVATVQLQYTDVNGLGHNDSFTVGAGGNVDIGYDVAAQNLVSIQNQQGTVALPGQIVTVFALSGNETGRALNVPVLNGDHADYTELFNALPTALPTASATPTPSESATN